MMNCSCEKLKRVKSLGENYDVCDICGRIVSCNKTTEFVNRMIKKGEIKKNEQS
jgi:hypothetical protein